MQGWPTRIAVFVAGVSIACNSDSGSTAIGQEGTPAPKRDAAVDASASAEASPSNDATQLGDGESDSASDGAFLDATGTDAALDSDSQSAASADSAPPGPPLCDPAHVWKTAGVVASVPEANFGRFGGISADETVIAWTSPTGVIYVDDRPARSQAFSATPSTINTASTPVANDRVALGSTGMDLFAVSADRKSFVAFYRSGVGATWGPSGALQFANVIALTTADGGQFSEPVLGADDTSFFYLVTPPNAPPRLFESTWDATQHVWTAGTPLPNTELTSQSASARRRATGASADRRTLFFYDEVLGKERAAWRDNGASAFVQFVDTPGLSEAAPNHRCDTLYFQQRGSDAGALSGPAVAQ